MKIRTLSILALAALAGTAACKKGDNAGGDSTATTVDTSVVQGTDTVTAPVAVPTTDTVVKTTETTTDTIKGDTVHADTVKK